MSPQVAAFLSVGCISLLSLLGVVTIRMTAARLKRWLLPLVALAAGAMLGDAFLHLLPEAVGTRVGKAALRPVFVTVLLGMLTFFVLEKAICWQHSHEPCEKEHIHPLGKMNLVGDTLHNFIDGIIIAGAYLGGGLASGFAVTLAVTLHEIPQEIGDFAILVHAGYSPRRALAYNLLSALAAVLGAALLLGLRGHAPDFVAAMTPFTAGAFIYIAASDLIPEIRKEERAKNALGLLGAFAAGIGMMLFIP